MSFSQELGIDLIDDAENGVSTASGEPRTRANVAERLFIATPDSNFRPQLSLANTTVYTPEAGLPRRSFIDLGGGLSMSCPELLFAEMATIMDIPHLVLLGYELCGSYVRDPRDPRNGNARVGVSPVTSTAEIHAFLDEARWVRGADRAMYALEFVRDDAWSAMEAMVAALAALPVGEFGYEMGESTLNLRVDRPAALVGSNAKSSRVPDILFGDTRVGINYDGEGHLNLSAIADAAREAERNPGEAYAQAELGHAMRRVRAKAVDDIRRNRELAAAGYTVFPVTKEDLVEEGGLDRVMAQVVEAIELLDGRDMSIPRRLVNLRLVKAGRQNLIWSLMPASYKRRRVSKGGLVDSCSQPPQVHEGIIEL